MLTPPTHTRPGSAFEVLVAFLRLGLSSFGGPIAHIGYFRDEFVTRRRWLDEPGFADLVGLCQFLPGPTSSQVGLSIGLMRGGYLGGLAAWAGFTLPSAVALVSFAYGAAALESPTGVGLLHGLKLVAVPIIAQAVWGMARTLCPDLQRTVIAIAAALLLLLIRSPVMQVAVIVLGGALGWLVCRQAVSTSVERELPVRVSRRVGFAALTVFFVLLAGLPLLRSVATSQSICLVEAFYRSGALVFGGGHVVLPLLRESFVTPGWISDDAFLAGYGAAQAVPGPLFTFAAYLGTVVRLTPHGIEGAALGLVSLFLPGVLILLGTLPFWESFRRRTGARAIMAGVNAAVVGILAAALYNPVWTASVGTIGDFALALIGLALLMLWRTPPLLVVIFSALGGIVLAHA
jgi:chromate transporter